MITGIIVALPEELHSLTAAKLVRGQWQKLNDTIYIAHAGAGPDNARRAAQQLLAVGVQRFISWGCAAALTADLRPGDLVIPVQLVPEVATDVGWQQRCVKILTTYVKVHAIPLTSSKVLVSTQAAKQALGDQTGAGVVDMETLAIAQVAQQTGMPFLAIRAIADPLDMNLPQAIAQALNADGEVVLTKLLRVVLRHPGELPALIQVGWQFNAARNTLKTVARHLVALCEFVHP